MRGTVGLIALVLVAAGCGSATSSGSRSGSPATTADHVVTIGAVASGTLAARTAHIEGTITASLPDGTEHDAFHGDADFAHHASDMTYSYSRATGTGGGEMRVIGQQLYTRSTGPDATSSSFVKGSASEAFAPLDGDSMTATTLVGWGMDDPVGAVGELRALASRVTTVGSARVRGVAVEHEMLTTSVGALFGCTRASSGDDEPPCAASTRRDPATINVWVDRESRMLRLDAVLDFGSDGKVESGVDYSKFGAPVHIAAPPKSEIVDPESLDQEFQPAPPAASPTVSAAWQTVRSGTDAGVQWSMAFAPTHGAVCIDFVTTPAVPVIWGQYMTGPVVQRDGHPVQCSDDVLGPGEEIEIVVSAWHQGAIDALVGHAAPEVRGLEVHLDDGTSHTVAIDPRTHAFAWVGHGFVGAIAQSSEGQLGCDEYPGYGIECFPETQLQHKAPPTSPG